LGPTGYNDPSAGPSPVMIVVQTGRQHMGERAIAAVSEALQEVLTESLLREHPLIDST